MSASLGIHTRNVSARERKYSLLSVAARLLPRERVAWCSKRVTGAQVEIRRNGDRCFYHGLARCGSVWVCPVCASKVSEERRAELKQASMKGYSLLLVSLTLQHSREDKLSELLSVLNVAWRKCRAGRAWQALEEKYKLVTSASALEVTYSQENGFHPHKHAILFSKIPESELQEQAQELEREISERWRSILEKHGHYGSEFYSVKVTTGSQVAAYCGKWGASEELTKSQYKQASGEHFSMWQLLERAGSGEMWAIAAFREFAQAIKGKKQLSWGAHARAILGLGEELSEQAIAESEPDPAQVVAVLTLEEWRLVCEKEKRGILLEIAEQEGEWGVLLFLTKLRESG